MDVVTIGMAAAAAKKKYRTKTSTNVALRPVANRVGIAFARQESGGKSNGTDTGGNYRTQHATPLAARAVRLEYSNIWNTAGAEATPTNSITVRASIERDGIFYPVRFDGKRDIVIEPGATVISDDTGFAIDPALMASIYTRTYVTVASAGMTWPISQLSAGVDGASRGTSTTDLTGSGTIAATYERMYAPTAILGIPLVEAPSWSFVTDSIGAGFSDTYSNSWMAQALTALGQMFINLGFASETVQSWTTNVNRYRRAGQLEYSNRILCTLGVNSLPLAEVDQRANLLAVWTFLAATGRPVYQATITPSTASTDSWATTANQTPTAHDAKRISINDWIRTVPAPLSGVIEAADMVESARNSGKWKVDGTAGKYTADGVHPTLFGHATMATAAGPIFSALPAV